MRRTTFLNQLLRSGGVAGSQRAAAVHLGAEVHKGDYSLKRRSERRRQGGRAKVESSGDSQGARHCKFKWREWLRRCKTEGGRLEGTLLSGGRRGIVLLWAHGAERSAWVAAVRDVDGQYS